MKNLNLLHAKFCPMKSLSNFWRSLDYLAAAKVVEAKGETPKSVSSEGTMVHTLVATAFLRWADPDEFYKRLAALI
jgi:hypothetical protein